jgi:ABC-2 type transport system permease protein
MRDLLPNALHVARREYLFRVRNRAFRITNVLLALAVALVTMVPTLLAVIGVDEPPHLGVSVQAEDLSADPVTSLRQVLVLADQPDPGAEGRDPDAAAEVTRVDDPETAAEQVRDGELDGLLTITRGTDGELAFAYLSADGPMSRTRLLVTQAAAGIAIADRMERAGIDADQGAELFAPPDFTAVPVNPDDSRSADDFGGAFILGYALVILTLAAIITYGTWVAQSVAEEKSNRVMKLLITAATPRQLLTGKLLGTGAAGLTQYAAVVAAVAIGLLLNDPVSDALGVSGAAPIQLPQLEPWLIGVFGAFFVLGFLLYAALYAAAGSMVSRIEDVQQASGLLMFLAMAGYFASFPALNDPDAGWVGPASLIPFFTPYLMPVRLLLASPSAGEVALAIGILIVTVVVAVWIASRIYSAGVLLYGQRASLRNVWRATRVGR